MTFVRIVFLIYITFLLISIPMGWIENDKVIVCMLYIIGFYIFTRNENWK